MHIIYYKTYLSIHFFHLWVGGWGGGGRGVGTHWAQGPPRRRVGWRRGAGGGDPLGPGTPSAAGGGGGGGGGGRRGGPGAQWVPTPCPPPHPPTHK